MSRVGFSEYLARRKRVLQRDLSIFFLENIHKESPVPLKQFIDEVEKTIINNILDEVNGQQRVAARILGIKPSTLNIKVKKYKIRKADKPSIRKHAPHLGNPLPIVFVSRSPTQEPGDKTGERETASPDSLEEGIPKA